MHVVVRDHHFPTAGKSPGAPNGPRQASTVQPSNFPFPFMSKNHSPVLGRKTPILISPVPFESPTTGRSPLLPNCLRLMVEAVYKPRKPKASPLYRCISEHFAEFEAVYEERYQNKFGVLRDVVREVIDKYRGCGDLEKGFARIKCKDCKHEILLAFSYKGRYFCPSCHQKRVLLFGEWITEHILYPLPHRQYVFTIPGLLRPYFRFDRKLLGKLSQCAYQSLKEFFQTTLNQKKAMPGVVVSIQTFGDLVNFHPHLHCLVTDGCFMANGWFYVPLGNRRKEAGKPFSPQGSKDRCGEKNRQRSGRNAPYLEKFRFQRPPPGQNPKRGPPRAGTLGPIHPALPVFSRQNDLPAAKQDGSVSL
jgi:hypothetical protein